MTISTTSRSSCCCSGNVMVVYVNDLSLIMGNWIELGVKVCDGVYDTIQIVCCMLKQK